MCHQLMQVIYIVLTKLCGFNLLLLLRWHCPAFLIIYMFQSNFNFPSTKGKISLATPRAIIFYFRYKVHVYELKIKNYQSECGNALSETGDLIISNVIMCYFKSR